jgi:hypothetical protein
MSFPPRLPLVAAFTVLAFTLTSAADMPLRERLDLGIQAGWQNAREKVVPAARADDATFLRRIYLDLAGTIPTADEAKQFLADKDPKKRDKLIDTLLADPRFATQQANVWDLAIFGRNPQNFEAVQKRDKFKSWLTGHFTKNTPYDRWVRELLLAEEPGTEFFYVQYRNQAEETTVAVSRLFLGTQLQCARCHSHPFEKWTQKDFYGMAGFFVRLTVLEAGSGNNRTFTIGEKSSGDVLYTGPVQQQKPGVKGTPVKPKFLGGPELAEPPMPKDFKEPDYRTAKTLPKPYFSRKQEIVAWITSRDNPYFARAVVNRVWGQYMGRGFVHPIDDLNEVDETPYAELLNATAKEFVNKNFDLKWLIGEIVRSEAYQRSSVAATTDALPRHYERARVRPLSAEELIDAIGTAIGDNTPKKPGETKLPSSTASWIMRYFGEPTDGQGEFQGSLREHLFLNNAGELRQAIAAKPGNLAHAIGTSKEPWEARVDRLFLSILTRYPKPAERAKFVQYLQAEAKPGTRIEEAIWVLLNTSEFRFNR